MTLMIVLAKRSGIKHRALIAGAGCAGRLAIVLARKKCTELITGVSYQLENAIKHPCEVVTPAVLPGRRRHWDYRSLGIVDLSGTYHPDFRFSRWITGVQTTCTWLWLPCRWYGVGLIR